MFTARAGLCAAVVSAAFAAPLLAAVSLNVRDFGAVGDGVHDDTLAIQKAADALYPGETTKARRDIILLARDLGRGGKYDGASGEVFFPKGVYRVTGPVKFFWCVNVRGEKGTVIRNDTKDQDTFYFHLGLRVRLDSLAFEGGYIQVRQWTRNLSDAILFVSGCSFSNAAGTGLVSDSWGLKDNGSSTSDYFEKVKGCPPYEISRGADGRVLLARRDPATLRTWPNSTEILVEDCRFRNNVCAFDLASDGIFMRDCDVVADATATGAAARVDTTAHLGRVRFSTVANPAAPAQCALRFGRDTTLTDCSFSSVGPVAALATSIRACRGNIASHLVLKDVVCDMADAPVVRFGEGSFCNMVVVDGLKANEGKSSATRKLFAFERVPTDEEVALWPKENSRGCGSVHPSIDVRKCIGVEISNVSTAFDTSLPASLEKFRRTASSGVRRHGAIRLSPLPDYGGEITDAGIGGDLYDSGAEDDSGRLQALFDKAARAGVATVVLPPKWIKLDKTVEVSGKVRVIAHGQAVVTVKDGEQAFRVEAGSDALFENVLVYRGRNAVSCEGDRGVLRVRNCGFFAQEAESISAVSGGNSKWRIELTGGTASTPYFYKGNAAPFLIDGFWHTVGPETTLGLQHRKSFASVVNLSGGIMEIQDVIGVPRYFDNEEIGPENRKKTGDYCWFNNCGTLRLYQFRFGGERGGLTPIYHREGASTYVEGGFAAHLRNWRLRDRKADAIATCKDPDLKFVDVVGFNFFDEPPMTMLHLDKGGTTPIPGKAFNCYPYPLPSGRVVVRPADNGRVLSNPGMGWVMHYYDNGPRYGTTIATGDDLRWFPGCSVVYLRLPWAHLEPEEGKFNWNAIDTPAQQWISRGGQVAFRITCSETMKEATPEWVARAGAKTVRWNWPTGIAPDGKYWECVPDDPVYLEKLGNFLAAFARRYDGRPEVAFVDIGSVGIWGEGHTGRTIQLSQEETQRIVKLHIDLHRRYFKKTLLVANDDFSGSKAAQSSAAMDYALAKGLGWRDDSIMVDEDDTLWYHERQAAAFWPKCPVVLEAGHYHVVKERGTWSAEALLDSIEAHHASYYSIHGDPRIIYDENRAAILKANLRLGYRFQPQRIAYPSHVVAEADPEKAEAFSVEFAFANAGAAPCYRSLYPCLTMKTESGGIAAVLAVGEFDLSKLPVSRSGEPEERVHVAEFTLGRWQLPVLPHGGYDLFLSVGEADGTPVCELPLGECDGQRRYQIGRIWVAAK